MFRTIIKGFQKILHCSIYNFSSLITKKYISSKITQLCLSQGFTVIGLVSTKIPMCNNVDRYYSIFSVIWNTIRSSSSSDYSLKRGLKGADQNLRDQKREKNCTSYYCIHTPYIFNFKTFFEPFVAHGQKVQKSLTLKIIISSKLTLLKLNM